MHRPLAAVAVAAGGLLLVVGGCSASRDDTEQAISDDAQACASLESGTEEARDRLATISVAGAASVEDLVVVVSGYGDATVAARSSASPELDLLLAQAGQRFEEAGNSVDAAFVDPTIGLPTAISEVTATVQEVSAPLEEQCSAAGAAIDLTP